MDEPCMSCGEPSVRVQPAKDYQLYPWCAKHATPDVLCPPMSDFAAHLAWIWT